MLRARAVDIEAEMRTAEKKKRGVVARALRQQTWLEDGSGPRLRWLIKVCKKFPSMGKHHLPRGDLGDLGRLLALNQWLPDPILEAFL